METLPAELQVMCKDVKSSMKLKTIGESLGIEFKGPGGKNTADSVYMTIAEACAANPQIQIAYMQIYQRAQELRAREAFDPLGNDYFEGSDHTDDEGAESADD